MAEYKPFDEKKYNITFRLPYWLIQEIKKNKGYSRTIEKILVNYFRNQDKSENGDN